MKKRCQKQDISPELHNLAVPGVTAEYDLSDQLTRFFTLFLNNEQEDSPASNPSKPDPRLSSNATTYFFFFGIKDCGSTDVDDLEAIIETIFDAVHDLYVKAGARNFVLVDSFHP
ncbi:hypothetical protein EUX98_g7770 [Antrodiella citrinella]|uniref:Uncharacterized protein n=1 Tax=Antrodiella citrinella TaxID=2447956 RepID=A0A4S4MKP3_9APHY|nr:hypothetical protein EUX98_g7770 [Antrodiella citrinella]